MAVAHIQLIRDLSTVLSPTGSGFENPKGEVVESNHGAPLGAPMSAEYRSGHRGWQPIGGLGIAASVLIGLAALLAVLRTVGQVTGKIELALLYEVLYILALLSAAVVFIVWVRRARANVHLVAGQRMGQRRGTGGRFFWVTRYVGDVWRASSPSGANGERLVLAWWVTWLASRIVPSLDRSVADRYPVAVISVLLEVAAAVLAVLIIRKISQWQAVSPV
jgi:hypothetical protein